MKSRVRKIAERVFVTVSLLIGIAAFISISQALGDALGAAYQDNRVVMITD
jgi:hypothetical protein